MRGLRGSASASALLEAAQSLYRRVTSHCMAEGLVILAWKVRKSRSLQPQICILSSLIDCMRGSLGLLVHPWGSSMRGTEL